MAATVNIQKIKFSILSIIIPVLLTGIITFCIMKVNETKYLENNINYEATTLWEQNQDKFDCTYEQFNTLYREFRLLGLSIEDSYIQTCRNYINR